MKKLTFEEVAKEVKEFNPDYELVEYINNKNIILKYIPSGEEFKCTLRWFLLGKAHAPSIVREINRRKKQTTCFERYGFENPMQNKEIRDKQKKTCLEKYGVENVSQCRKVRHDIEKTCIDKFGTKSPIERFNRSGIKLIGGKTMREISLEKGLSYSYITQLHNKGVDIMNYEKSEGTQIEQSIKSILGQLGLEFEREKWFNDGKIRVDFYIPKFDLIIEANGIYWHSDKKVEKDYHFNRRKTLNDLGFKVIQFNQIEIIEDPIRVKYMIKDMIETGGKESYIYEDDYLVVNLDYSISPANFELVEEWIEEYEIQGHKIYNSGFKKLIKI